jgi:hypothetical protein
MLQNIFEAKAVPASLLFRIKETRNYPCPDWPAVVQTVSGKIEDFDYYFDFVVSLIERLDSGRVE